MKNEHMEEYNAYKSFLNDFEGELVEIHSVSRFCAETKKCIEWEEVKVYNKDWFIKDLDTIFELKKVSERAFDKQMALWFSFLYHVKEQINKNN